MIVNKENKSYQTRSDKPNSNWLEDENYYVIEDGSDLYLKVIQNYPFFDFVEGEEGELIDIIVDTVNKEKEYQKEQKLKEIEKLKQNLFDTDYKAIKYSEGQLTEEEYYETKVQRQQWRDRINELESEV